jgi:hypothetical protein
LPTEFVVALSLIKKVHIGARALLDMKLTWFGYIARLSQWGREGHFTRLKKIATCLRGA